MQTNDAFMSLKWLKLPLFFIFAALSPVANASDLDMFSLKGPVDSICIKMNDAGMEWQSEFTFDVDGNLIEIDGEEPNCHRGKDGRIDTIILEDTAEDDESLITSIEMKLNYDKGGRVVSVHSHSGEESWLQKFYYDEKGLLQKKEDIYPDYSDMFTYRYLNFDSYGNWTKRIEKLTSMDQSVVQTRDIIYVE